MKLVSVYDVDNAAEILFSLLKEREPHVNISHKEMPTWEEHCKFIESMPYREWLLIINDAEYAVGSVYMTHRNEIGVHIFESMQRKGYGRFAVNAMILRYPNERLVANINPENKSSIRLFSSYGFKFIQVTFAREPV